MSNHEEKNQAAKAKAKQNEQRPQGQKQQPGNRPQDMKGNSREDNMSPLRNSESDRSSQRPWSTENDRNSYDR